MFIYLNNVVLSLFISLHLFSLLLKIMQAAHVDEHEQLASHVTPGHALSVGQPPFFLSRDAVNFAALDYLVGLTGKVKVHACTCIYM